MRRRDDFVGDFVRQFATLPIAAIRKVLPFQLRQLDSLFRPNCIDMRMGQVSQPQIRPDRFWNIQHGVAGPVPGRKDT